MVSQTVSDNTGIERVTIPIDGLTCRDDDSLTIERAIRAVKGVRRAYVNAATEMAYVEFDPAQCTPGQLAAAIEQDGFCTGTPVRR